MYNSLGTNGPLPWSHRPEMSNTALTDDQDIPAPPAPGTEDMIDEALVGLPAPPRARRRVLSALLTGVSVASLALAWQLRDDVQYAMAPSVAADLGDGRVADPGSVGSNRYVSVHATPSMAGAVVYSRPLAPGEQLVFPVAGRDAASPWYIQVDRHGGPASRGEYTGRLIPFHGGGGRYARVGRYLHDDLGAPVEGSTWLLVDGTTPRSTLWAPVVASLLVALALSDMALLVRLLRPSPP